MSREDKVQSIMLHEIEKIIAKKRGCVIDDCMHNLDPQFRQKVIALIPKDSYNCVIKFFPIKLIFANARIAKDIEDGKKRYNPTQLELEEQLTMYADTEKTMSEEGWITSTELKWPA